MNPEVTSVDNLVSFHQTYLEYRECQDDILFVNMFQNLNPPERGELSDLDPGYADGSIDRPEGHEGDFRQTRDYAIVYIEGRVSRVFEHRG
jgi:hypothetical protein